VLAQIRDDKQLAEALSAITQDPSIHVDDAKTRPLAQALMTEGVRQLQAQAYDQALANFLEAYNKFPSPKILLDVAATLRDMGRLADAANTYQRYLEDPATGAERIAEVKQLLLKLDEQLTILTVRVFPRGAEVSIDGGPFVAVGSSLLTRVRPGIHLLRVKKGEAADEVTINGFEGETKDVPAALKVQVTDVAPPPPAQPPPAAPPTTAGGLPLEREIPDHVEGWLITGTQYGSDSATGRERRVRTGYAGPEVAAIVPHYELTDTGEAQVQSSEDHISSGAIAMLRVDGKGRGAAGAFGVAYTPEDHVELELAALRSDTWGAYVGGRYRILTGKLRPYVALGMPMFFFTDQNTMSSRVAIGARGAGGLELEINGHFSVTGDLGVEHFFNVSGVVYNNHTIEATVFVPTVGVIGRL